MSLLIMDLNHKSDEVTGYIRFRLFNQTHEMHLVRFNELLRFPPFGATIPTHADYNPKSFWTTLTCLGQKNEVRSSRAPWICNPVLHYFQRLTANHIFPQVNSQNGVRASELFIL